MDFTATCGTDHRMPPLSSTGGPVLVALESCQPSNADDTPGLQADELCSAMDAVLSLRRRAEVDNLLTFLIDRALHGLSTAARALRDGDAHRAREKLLEALGVLGETGFGS